MFCYNCGHKIIENGKFCMECGTEIPLTSKESSAYIEKQNSNQAISKISFNILDQSISLDKKCSEYAEIRSYFENRATKAYKTMNDKIYWSLEGFVKNSIKDYDVIMNGILRDAIELLHKKELYNVNYNTLLSELKCITSEFKQFHENASNILSEINNNLNAQYEYRSAKKQNRSRLIGGGFGISGAVKGIIAAESINAISGLAHSVNSSAKNIKSNFQAMQKRSEVHNNPDFKQDYLETIYIDVLSIHRVIISVLNKNNHQIPNGYKEEAKIQAETLFENIQKNIIDSNSINKTLAEVLFIWPFDTSVYEYILSRNDDDDNAIEEYANFFKLDIENVKETANRKKAFNMVFGENSHHFFDVLKDNYFYQKLENELDEDPMVNLQNAYLEAQKLFNFNNSNIYIFPFDKSENIFEAYNRWCELFTNPLENEVPLFLYFDTSRVSVNGFLLTDKAIHHKLLVNSADKLNLQDIGILNIVKDYIEVNNKSILLLKTERKNRTYIIQFIIFIILVFKGACEKSIQSDAPSNLNNSLSNQVKYIIDNIKDKKIHENFFYNYNTTTINEKVKNATSSYAQLDEDETVLAIYDDTIFGKASKGFLITDKNLHFSSSFFKISKIKFSNIISVELQSDVRAILINQQHKVSISFIPTNKQNDFIDCLTSIVDILR